MRDFAAHVRRHLSRQEIPDERYDGVVDELASELEARYTALIQRGSTDEEAWREVLTQVPSWADLSRDLASAGRAVEMRHHPLRVRVLLSAERWLREFTLGLRALRKDRGFAATAIVTLTICLGGHAAVLAGVNAMLFRALPVPESGRVLLMANQYPLVEARRGTLSATPDYEDRLQHVTVFDEQALYNRYAGTLDTGDLPAFTRGMTATPSLLRLLRVKPALGRIFTDDEGTVGNETRIMLTDGLWRELFGADPGVIGRTLRLTGREFTIVGVLPRDFSFGDPAARFWVPLTLTESQRSYEARHRNGWLSVGRLRPGATIAQVHDQLKALDAINFERTPRELQTILRNTGFYTGVEPLRDALVRDIRAPLYLLWGAALGVLAIGLANLGSIVLARSRTRLSEMGTRLAIGAGRFDVVRPLLVEGLLIALGGAAGGLLIAPWMLSTLRLSEPGSAQPPIDITVVGITLGLAGLAGLLIGVVSASPFYTMRIGTMLQAGTRTGTRARASRATRRALVVSQMGCSFMLVMGASLLWISLRNVLAFDPGVRTENVVTGAVVLPVPRYAADEAARSFVNRSLESIRRLPGVVAAGATTIVPFRGVTQTGPIVAQGYVPQPGEPLVSGIRSFVTPGYFEAVGTALLRGRYFDDRDNAPGSRTLVIDDRLARRFWPDGDAIGQRMFWPSNPSEFAIDANTPWLTVIGIVRNAQLAGPTPGENPLGTAGTYYVPYAVTAPRNVGFVIRTAGAPAGMIHGARSVLARIDREIPFFDIQTMAERTDLALRARTNTMHLATLFAVFAVFLSAVGLYGALAYLVDQRRREIGVRLAVGATPTSMIKMVFREGLLLALGGVVLGAAASLAVGGLVASQLYGVESSNPWVMLLTTATLSAVTALACVIPARRAAFVDVTRILSTP